MTTRQETSYEKDVKKFKYLWELSIYEGLVSSVDKLIVDATHMRTRLMDERWWLAHPDMFELERGVAHIRNCYLEIANIKQSNSCFILAKDRADRLAAREEDEKARLAEWDKAREAEEEKG